MNATSYVGPSVLRSHALSMLYRDVRDGRLDEKTGRDQLDGLAGLKIRLLGDRVSRSRAWKFAEQLGWDDTTAAEYLAVAVLQADALVTEDEQLIAGARGLVPLALLRRSPPLIPSACCARASSCGAPRRG